VPIQVSKWINARAVIYMKICEICGKEFPNSIIIDGVRRILKSRKHCLDCVPFGTRLSPNKTKERNYGECLYCGEPLKVRNRTFCNNHCQQEYEYIEYIKKWKSGEVTGCIGKSWIDVSGYVRRYIFEKFNNKCSRCDWSEINPYTNKLPLEVEHIDGDATNNKEENLTLLCPNCHSLTKTYRGANKGNGTRDIKWVSRSGTTNVG
jgi:5-methylcytosine-specific restriction endonuclease McrA